MFINPSALRRDDSGRASVPEWRVNVGGRGAGSTLSLSGDVMSVNEAFFPLRRCFCEHSFSFFVLTSIFSERCLRPLAAIAAHSHTHLSAADSDEL